MPHLTRMAWATPSPACAADAPRTSAAPFFGTPIAVACTWDSTLYADIGAASGIELRALGQDLNLGPTLNIVRYPLGGHNWEYFSEDPYLVARLIAPYVKAQQEHGIICGSKHYVANERGTSASTSTTQWTSARCAKSTCLRSKPLSRRAVH